MEPKITHGKICRKVEVHQTQTPIFTSEKETNELEPTITLNFYVGSVKSEEILSKAAAKHLLSILNNFLF